VSLVVDASTALSAVLPDEGSSFGRAALSQALSDSLVMPALWLYEVQNVLAMAIRRERIDELTAYGALDQLRSLRVACIMPQALGHEFRIAKAQGLTAYDAAYLTVALATGAQLATNDERLRRAAERVGVALFIVPD
jgi:predicted nucleic acid-binding protein